MKPTEIDHVLFVGGSCRMPMVAQMLQKIFPDATKFSKIVNLEEVVAVGAAMYAAACTEASYNHIITRLIHQQPIEMLNDVVILEFESNHFNKIPLRTADFNLAFARAGVGNYSIAKIYPIPKSPTFYDSSLNAVGIDLGTTRSCTAVNKNGKIDVIAIDNSDRPLPSFVGYEEGLPTCGSHVARRMPNFSKHAVFDVKRIIGKPYESVVIDPFWPFKVIKDLLDVGDFHPDIDATIPITRQTFKELSQEILVRLNAKVRETLDSINFTPDQINYVLQVGGGCRMAMVKELLRDIFPNSHHRSTVDPDWAVAYGASLYCCHLMTECHQMTAE
uniref:Heat shock protein 70 n=1 Tax=Panagrolaimus davidi TaxID=227884 RepID=A0A914PRV7_9BILA